MAATRMIAGGARAGTIVVVRLAYGDDVLDSLHEICRREKIRNGVIVTGFGSLTDVSVTGAIGPDFPPRRFYNRKRPRGAEIISMSGVIADYHVHCHLVLCDRRGAFGGHLERGCHVLSLAEIALMRVDGVKLARLLDPATGQRLLQAVSSYAGINNQSDGDGSLHTVATRLTGATVRGEPGEARGWECEAAAPSRREASLSESRPQRTRLVREDRRGSAQPQRRGGARRA